jgi:hypothetical protein
VQIPVYNRHAHIHILAELRGIQHTIDSLSCPVYQVAPLRPL